MLKVSAVTYRISGKGLRLDTKVSICLHSKQANALRAIAAKKKKKIKKWK